jgi:hypothetical protein
MGQGVLRTKAYPHFISEDHKSSDWRSGAHGKGFTLFILSRVIVDSWPMALRLKSSRNPDAKNAANQVDKFQMRESSTRTRQECTWYHSRVRQRRWIVGMPPSWNCLAYCGAIPAYRNPLPRSYREHLVSEDEELRDRSPDYPPIQLVDGRLRVSGKRQSTRWTTYGHA